MLKFIAPLVIALSTLTACTEDSLSVRSGELENLSGLKITISGAELGHDKVQAIAKHIEGKAHDVGGAMVRMKKDDQGPAALEIEIFAKSLPAEGSVAADLKAAFPELAAATISTAPAQGGGGQLPVVEVSADLTPEEAKAEIAEQLQAQGVDGKIEVQVEDGAEGRRVEVKVEKEITQP